MVSRSGLRVWLALSALAQGAVADSLGFRMPPDTRPRSCTNDFNTSVFANHTVSIIIPWLAESWEHMEGTFRALLHFTPDELVEEYIWISDGNKDSKAEELKALSPKAKIFAFEERQGLIRAKMRGVQMATAPVLVFMEAHCRPNRHWLEPLLERVMKLPKVLSMPALDGIYPNDWNSYYAMSPGHWRYEWNFNLIFTNPGQFLKPGSSKPYASPGTSGGIFAMRRDWFLELDLFDVGMLEWGGDHMELTMKVWRCGGRIEIVPCSRIGHLYRSPEERPYDVNVDQVVMNYKRLAELWAKDHLKYFYDMKPEAKSMKLVDFDRVRDSYNDLKTRLSCKDLQWYLDNVDLEMAWEKERICHPFAPHGDPIRCQGKLVPGRWTITEAISGAEFRAMRKDAKKRREAARLARAESAEGDETAGDAHDGEL